MLVDFTKFDYRYPHYDHRGSVATLTDKSGTVVASYLYDAWGNILNSTESAAVEAVGNRFKYQSNWMYLGEGLYLSPARLYHAGVGRFLQPDPMVKGQFLAHLFAFNSWRRYPVFSRRIPVCNTIPYTFDANSYCYANNTPMHFVDSFGLLNMEEGPEAPDSAPKIPASSGAGPITPSSSSGWEYENSSGRWSKDAENFWNDDMTDAERAMGRDQYNRGCVGVTNCKLRIPTEDFTKSSCFTSEPQAMTSASSMNCPSGQTAKVFAVRYWDRDKMFRDLNSDGSYPVDPNEVYAGRSGYTNFDFGYRQSNGSYIHANHGGVGMKVKLSPSSKEFDNGYEGFNTVLYCSRCVPCT